MDIFHISLSLSVFVISAHEAVTEVVVVISKQVILLPADKAHSLCLDLAVDIDQKLLKESSHLQYVVALSHHDVVAVVLQLCEFSSSCPVAVLATRWMLQPSVPYGNTMGYWSAS